MGKVWSCPLLLQFFRRLPWLVVLAAFACPRLAFISLRLDMNCDEKTHTHIYYIYIYRLGHPTSWDLLRGTASASFQDLSRSHPTRQEKLPCVAPVPAGSSVGLQDERSTDTWQAASSPYLPLPPRDVWRVCSIWKIKTMHFSFFAIQVGY
jgi:hypothetical protein